MKTRDVLRAVLADGWREVPSKGGHRQFTHPTKPGRVTVPFHGMNADLSPKVVLSIERQGGLRLKESR